MLSQRFVVSLLLLCYGLPAAIGPHWHHHFIGVDDCCSVTCESLQAANPSSTCHCHGGHHQAANANAADENAEDANAVALAWRSADKLDDCLICAFYSQMQLNRSVESGEQSQALGERPKVQPCLAGCRSLLLWRARGPPV